MKMTGIDGIANSFNLLGHLAHGVMMQQLSKAGSDTKELMREEFLSRKTTQRTRVNKNGKAYIQSIKSSRPLGARESHTADNKNSNPDNMVFGINSALFEKSETLVVGGSHPAMVPMRREKGEIVGTMKSLPRVPHSTIAILDRLDSGKERGKYPTHSRLIDTDDLNESYQNFMGDALIKAKGSVKRRLTDGWTTAMKGAVNNAKVEKVIYG